MAAPPSHPPSSLPVIILGSGPSGLALGQRLRRAEIPFHIYERDAQASQRLQGYRVRINADGIAALKECLDADLYARLEKSCAARDVTEEAHGTGPRWKLNALTAEEDEGRGTGGGSTQTLKAAGAPEKKENEDVLNADRSVLRHVLMQGLQPFISYAKEFLSYLVNPTTGIVTAKFADGTQAEARLLVGADGSGSRVRKQLLPDQHLWDTEGRFIYAKTILTPELERQFNKKCLRGLTIVRDDSQKEAPMTLLLEAIRFQKNEFRAELPEDYVYWVLIAPKLRYSSIDDTKLLSLSNEESAALAKSLTAQWHPSFHPLFDLQDATQTAMIRIVSANPEIPRWDSSGSVTLIGDAVHVMSPTAGVGATSALRDAAKLGEMMAGEIREQAESVGRYEEAMRGWAKEALMRSQVFGKFLFGMPTFDQMKAIDI